MAVTAAGSGTQTATVTTLHTLLDVSAAGVYNLELDLVNMAAGDILEIRVYKMILTGGTPRGCVPKTFSGAPAVDDTIYVSIPFLNELTDTGSLRFTLKQTFGTGRAFPWKVLTT